MFGSFSSLPVAFPLLVPTVWAGLRFSAFGVALHSLAVCTTVVVLTIQGRGAFAAVGTWSDEVLVSQLFIGLVFCLGILLALGRGRAALPDRDPDALSRPSRPSQAEVLSAIIDTMHDGLTVIDETGQVLRRNPAGAEMVRTEPDRLNNLRDSALHDDDQRGEGGEPLRVPLGARHRGREHRQPGHRQLVFDDGSPTPHHRRQRPAAADA